MQNDNQNLTSAGRIASALRRRREELDLTQEEMGVMLKIPAAVVSHYETGFRAPNGPRLLRFMAVLDMDLEYILKPKEAEDGRE